MHVQDGVTTPGTARRVFVSYAREDRDAVRALGGGLARLHHDVWIDERLNVGQEWWAEILRQIETCDAVVVAVSPSLLASQASAAERGYAVALGRPLLPVCVDAVRPELLPTDLAGLQVVDYTGRSAEAAFDLAAALAAVPGATMPEHPPVPPPAPTSSLSDLARRVHAPSMSLDEQLALVARLRAELANDRHREAATDLLAQFRAREDVLLHTAAREIDHAMVSSRVAPARVAGSAGGRTPRKVDGRRTSALADLPRSGAGDASPRAEDVDTASPSESPRAAASGRPVGSKEASPGWWLSIPCLAGFMAGLYIGVTFSDVWLLATLLCLPAPVLSALVVVARRTRPAAAHRWAGAARFAGAFGLPVAAYLLWASWFLFRF